MISKRYSIAKEIVIPKLESQVLIKKRYEYLGNLSNELLLTGFYELIELNDCDSFKNTMFICSVIDAFQVKKLNVRMFDYALPKVSNILLSDNWNYLEKVYSKLSYNSFYIDDKTNEKKPLSMDKWILEGGDPVWCNTIQMFMANNTAGVERNLNVLETIVLPSLPKNELELKIDYEFYKALLSKDKSKCEELLEQLVSPKIHKKRNDNAILSKYVSQPALGYAKLAWRHGLEVEVNSPLIPKEILPIEPLEHYVIPYEFLKS